MAVCFALLDANPTGADILLLSLFLDFCVLELSHNVPYQANFIMPHSARSDTILSFHPSLSISLFLSFHSYESALIGFRRLFRYATHDLAALPVVGETGVILGTLSVGDLRGLHKGNLHVRREREDGDMDALTVDVMRPERFHLVGLHSSVCLPFSFPNIACFCLCWSWI